jgi:hypothetical protein
MSNGFLIVNADDWGREPRTSGRILDCVLRGAVSSVSAMVFMEDSDRAAAVARDRQIDAGLHVNFTTPFSGPRAPSRLVEHQSALASYLRRHRLAQSVFHPALIQSFEYVTKTQFDEFRRLYGADPNRVDGHHHMHLCANVLLGRLLPAGIVVRRNFSFLTGEKSMWNRMYRRAVDGLLARRHRLVDFLFSLQPLERETRLPRIFALARRFVVELETHPVDPEEYRFLERGEIFRQAAGVQMAPASILAGVGGATRGVGASQN